MDYKIVNMQASDWGQVSNIYWEGIQNKISTFQNTIPTWEEWDKGHCKSCRLVAKDGDIVLGWVALSPTSSRSVYAGVVDVSIYVGNSFKGKGVGRALLLELIRESEIHGFWTLQSRIIKENTASRELHKSLGFKEIGICEKLGKMDTGIWYDIVLAQRRSSVVGVD